MTALYRNGQPAEALAHYQQARALFNEELGAEPGEGLRAIQRRILIADPDLSKPTEPRTRPVPGGTLSPPNRHRSKRWAGPDTTL
jgi:DNA-binding SARP family transcriptional activator